jgi:hypothetical protein
LILAEKSKKNKLNKLNLIVASTGSQNFFSINYISKPIK